MSRRFSDAFLDELKDRVALSAVVGRFVPLRRQGREMAGLSPFVREKSPSFFVNDDKRFYHCFASGESGDAISFLVKTQGLTFVEAVEQLAGEAGMALPLPDPRSAERDARRAELTDWLALAADWFSVRLQRGHEGAAARDYLERRGLPADQWARFRLGFAPDDRTALKDHLVAKGAMPADLIACGLLVAPEDGGSTYDRFRGRIMFPIIDSRGRVVSFGGRAMDAARRAKYLNGPETPVFHKGRALYGLPGARDLLRTGGRPLVVVEGYMDVIACQRADVPAVAPMGTALTEEQMALLWRLHPEPTLCFDGDRAGLAARGRAVERALPLLRPGKTFGFASVAGGKDPDDVLRDQGADVLRAQLGAATPFVRALFEVLRGVAPLDTPERMAGLKAALRAAVAAMTDRDLGDAYRRHLFGLYDQLWAARRRRVGVDLAAGASPELKAWAARVNAGEIQPYQRDVLAALLALDEPTPEQAAAFDQLDRLSQVREQIDALRLALATPEDFDRFKALKAERDQLERDARQLDPAMIGGAA